MNKFIIGILTVLILGSTHSFAQEVTSKQKRQVKTIATTIDKAGRLYQSEKYKSAADKISAAQKLMRELSTDASADLLKLLAAEHDRLKTAHKLLSKQDVELQALADLPAPTVAGVETVSFTKEIAPILVQNCGRCHVTGNRGDFSARNYEALMNSLHVSPGRAETSRLVEVIADGDMPPNGSVPDADLTKLKNWIQQGAKFDGDNPSVALNQLTGTPMQRAPRQRMQANKPTGSETVSFGLNVAPILIESCSGCHINSRQVRGNLNMDNFVRLLRGGDSGNLIQPGKPNESTLLMRLKGINSEVMPPNRKLSDKKIGIIETWIAEGASFDGPSTTMQIGNVVAVAVADSQTHEELLADRDKLGVKNWKLIMSDDVPDVIDDEHFRFIGNNRSQILEAVANQTNELRELIVEEIGSDPLEPFVKGNPTIYLFEKRYDLHELGMMLVGREFPKHQAGRWDFTSIDAYSAILLNRGKSADEIRAQMTQQLSALHIASMAGDVPRWFADGVGYIVASKLNRKSTAIKQWQAAASEVSGKMETPFDFATGKLNDLDAGLAGYVYVQRMKSNRSMDRILELLKNGSLFEEAFAAAVGKTPQEFFRQDQRRRRRR